MSTALRFVYQVVVVTEGKVVHFLTLLYSIPSCFHRYKKCKHPPRNGQFLFKIKWHILLSHGNAYICMPTITVMHVTLSKKIVIKRCNNMQNQQNGAVFKVENSAMKTRNKCCYYSDHCTY